MADFFGMNIGTFIPSFQTIAIIFVIFLTFMVIILGIIIFWIQKRKIELDLYQERAGGGYRKIRMTAKRVLKDGVASLKIGRVGVINKLIPDVESNYLYPNKKGKDALNVMQDEKGFLHKLRIPPLNEMVDYLVYKEIWKEVGNHMNLPVNIKHQIKARAIEIKKNFLKENPDHEVFMMPNPHETLEFVARQIQKGKEKYAATFLEKWGWLALPLGAMTISLIMILFAMIFSNRILGG